MKKQPKQNKMAQSEFSAAVQQSVNEKNQATFEQLQSALQEAQVNAEKFRIIGQEAVNRLITIENKLANQGIRKPNLMTVLFHWKELMVIIGEIVSLIREFKDLLQKPQEPQAESNNAQNDATK